MGHPAANQSINCRATRRLAGRLLLLTILIGPIPVESQSGDRMEAGSKAVLGVRNQPLKAGADLMLAGDFEEGVRLTHIGLAQARGSREEEAGLSNLCAGYIKLEKYDLALQYCDMLLVRNERNWHGYNNRALLYIRTEQWDKAEADLIKGEALNAGAYTMKVVRSKYMNAVHPVAPEIEIDDSKIQNREEKE